MQRSCNDEEIQLEMDQQADEDDKDEMHIVQYTIKNLMFPK